MSREKKTVGELMKLAAERIEAAGIRGLTRSTVGNLKRALDGTDLLLDHVYVEWERAWAVSARLSVSVEYQRGKADGVVTVRVNWPATDRTPGAARASIALYAEVADLACELETFLGEFGIRKED